ncbi:MAG TPA: hypothetical protein VGL97_03055 [Bryobacteraceae bacterium]|jgi:hypothetical protein
MSSNELGSGRRNWEGMALPLVLMVTGLILIAGDHFGLLSLDRIQNLWPMAVILVGLAELIPGPSSR